MGSVPVSSCCGPSALRASPAARYCHKKSSVNERFKCSRIEPCEAASYPRDFECPGAQLLHVEIRDFQLAAARRLDLGSISHDVLVVEIKTCADLHRGAQRQLCPCDDFAARARRFLIASSTSCSLRHLYAVSGFFLLEHGLKKILL